MTNNQIMATVVHVKRHNDVYRKIMLHELTKSTWDQ